MVKIGKDKLIFYRKKKRQRHSKYTFSNYYKQWYFSSLLTKAILTFYLFCSMEPRLVPTWRYLNNDYYCHYCPVYLLIVTYLLVLLILLSTRHNVQQEDLRRHSSSGRCGVPGRGSRGRPPRHGWDTPNAPGTGSHVYSSL